MAAKQSPKPRRTTAAPPARADVPAQEMRQRIEIAAYYKAQQRGFEPGHELEDWITAEKEVRAR